MIDLKTRTKQWGNSVGVILPKDLGIGADEEVRIHIERASGVSRVRDLFGKFRTRTPTRDLMRKIDRELDA